MVKLGLCCINKAVPLSFHFSLSAFAQAFVLQVIAVYVVHFACCATSIDIDFSLPYHLHIGAYLLDELLLLVVQVYSLLETFTDRIEALELAQPPLALSTAGNTAAAVSPTTVTNPLFLEGTQTQPSAGLDALISAKVAQILESKLIPAAAEQDQHAVQLDTIISRMTNLEVTPSCTCWACGL